jgi:hypothetical protein
MSLVSFKLKNCDFAGKKAKSTPRPMAVSRYAKQE